MRWSWRIARVSGIEVYLHATLLILLAWLGYQAYVRRHQWGDTLENVLLGVCFFVIVLLHELGHAWAARSYGVRALDITLMPVGGVARLDRFPRDSRQELAIALAGPAVNFLFAALYWGTFRPLVLPIGESGELGAFPFLEKLMLANLGMGLFNLVPAFPMDGGRVLRALLGFHWSYARSTRLASTIGQAFAFAFGAVSLYVGNPIWAFVALLVYLGAEDENEMVQASSALAGVPIRDFMIRELRTLEPNEPIRRAVEHTLAGFHYDFPVLERDRVVGVLTRRDLLTALGRHGPTASVADVMQREFVTARPDDEAEEVFARLEQGRCRSLPVVEAGRLEGLITAENVGEYLMIRSALRSREARPTPS